jgi:hypothetical protein
MPEMRRVSTASSNIVKSFMLKRDTTPDGGAVRLWRIADQRSATRRFEAAACVS